MIEPKQQKEIELFYDYLLTDELGDWAGLADNAPETARKAYNDFMREQEKAKKAGVKV